LINIDIPIVKDHASCFYPLTGPLQICGQTLSKNTNNSLYHLLKTSTNPQKLKVNLISDYMTPLISFNV